MEYYKRQLCVSYEELTGGPDPLVPEGTLKSWQYRRKVRQVRKAYGEGVTALYAYDSLPGEVRERYDERHGSPRRDVLCMGPVPYVEDVDARAHYETYRYVKGGEEVALTDRLIEEYTANASVANMLLDRWRSLTALSNKLCNRRSDLWRVMCEYAAHIGRQHGHTLPLSAGRLRRKLHTYKEEGYDALISGKIGNASASKITPEAGLYILGLKRNRDDVLTNSQLLEEYNRTCATTGHKPVTLSTLTAWLNAPRTRQLWLDVEQGEVAANKELTRLQRTLMPTRRNSVWEGDGTRLNLYYNDGGRLATIDVYMVIDVATRMWLGWSYGSGETYEMVRSAFRMALERSGERPYQIKTDNQGAIVSARGRKLVEDIALMRTNSAPYRSSSKMIENELGDFQQVELHRYPNFTGQNVTTGKRPNLEWLHANMDRVPDYEGMIRQFEESIRRWNNTVVPRYGKTRAELYEEWVNDELSPVSRADYIRIFWQDHDYTNLYTQSGITITVDRREYTYEVLDERGLPDIGWLLEHTGERFRVRYNPDDMTEACLYAIGKDGEERYERELHPYLRIVRAVQDQSSEDATTAQILVNMDKQMRILRVARCRAIDYLFERDYEQPRVAGLSAADNDKVERLARELYEKYRDRVRRPAATVLAPSPKEAPKATPLIIPARVTAHPKSLGQTMKEESKLDWTDLVPAPGEKQRSRISKY